MANPGKAGTSPVYDSISMGSRDRINRLPNGSNTSLTSPMDVADDVLGLKRTTSQETTVSGASTVSISTDGCLVLGTDQARGNKYVTRFRIDRGEQRESLAGDILKEECLPCMQPEARHSCKKFAWALFTAEPLLLFLHISAICFGAIKEGLGLRAVAEDMHITASCLETYVALQVIVTRTVVAWMDYRALKEQRTRVEYVHSATDLHNPRLKRALWFVTITGIVLVLGAITAFICFYFKAHLGWTILSNNLCIVLITASAGLLGSRIRAEMSGISEDQHKAVVYEMVLLLTEGAWAKTPQDRKKVYSRADRFCKALRDTDVFKKPDYINMPSESMPSMNLISTLELQSFV